MQEIEIEEEAEVMEKEVKFGVWKYYLNEEGAARWKCSICGKICRKNPVEKNYCSNCGAKMSMEQ